MKAKTKRKPKRNPGQQPHVPTIQTKATVRAMAGVGYSQRVIARHIGVSEPTLRLYHRELIENSIESACAHVFANLVKTATTKNDAAGVLAAKFILSVRAGWKESSRLEIEQNAGRGIGAMLQMLRDAPPPEGDEDPYPQDADQPSSAPVQRH
jgi:hypothetical protein